MSQPGQMRLIRGDVEYFIWWFLNVFSLKKSLSWNFPGWIFDQTLFQNFQIDPIFMKIIFRSRLSSVSEKEKSAQNQKKRLRENPAAWFFRWRFRIFFWFHSNYSVLVLIRFWFWCLQSVSDFQVSEDFENALYALFSAVWNDLSFQSVRQTVMQERGSGWFRVQFLHDEDHSSR